jgi:hypothetical protein
LSCASIRLNVLTFDTATQQQMADWCTSQCLPQLEAGLGSIALSCAATAGDRALFSDIQWVSFVVSFRQAVFFARGVCVQDGTTYCWPRLQALKLASLQGETVEAATLDAVCNDACIPKILVAINAFAGPEIAKVVKVLEFYCLKKDGVYCALQLKNIAAAITVSQTTGKPDLSLLCVPCMNALLYKAAQLYSSFNPDGGNPYGGGLSIISLYCAKAEDGQFCIDKFIAASQSLAGTMDDNPCAQLNTTCTQDCRSAMAQLKAALGCCLGSMFKVISPAVGIIFKTIIKERCGITINTCSGLIVRGTIRVLNFYHEYYLEHKEAIDAAIAADIALKLDIDANSVVVDTSADSSITTTGSGFYTQATTSAVTYTYTVTPSSSSEATAIANAVATSLASDVNMAATNQAGLEGKADPIASVTVDTTASTATTATNPDGPDAAFCTASVDMLAMALPALLALL